MLLGLRSALAAAAAIGDRSAQVAAWQGRLTRLDAAIAALYDPATHAYREGNATGNAYNVDYGDGGWLLWPVQFRPYGETTMRDEAAAVQASMDTSLASGEGEYEAKALLGLAHAWTSPTTAQRAELRRVLGYLASTLTTNTGLFGEAWRRLKAGRPQPVEDMPHVWEHTLFYLSGLAIDGSVPYRFASTDFYAQACASGEAPPSACPGRVSAGLRSPAPAHPRRCAVRRRGRGRHAGQRAGHAARAERRARGRACRRARRGRRRARARRELAAKMG